MDSIAKWKASDAYKEELARVNYLEKMEEKK